MKDDIEGYGIVGRMGGKRLLKNKIVSQFPDDYENMKYVECFIGGGSIFFKKEPSVIEVINDIDKDLINIYRGFKKYDFDKIKEDVNGNYDKELFNKIRDSKPKSTYNKFIQNFILYRTSYFSLKRQFGNLERINLKSDYGERLKNVKIFNKDYKDIIKKFDSKNTLFYLDPPYEGSTSKHYEDFNMDYDELYNILKNIKGKFLLSINDSKNIRNLFKNFNIKTVSTKYTEPNKGGLSRVKKELLIKNY